MSRKRVFFILFFLLFVIALQSRGVCGSVESDPKIEMDVQMGIDGYYKNQIPIPVTVNLKNGGTEKFDGRIIIRTNTWVPRASYVYDLSLNPGVEKSHDMFVYESFTRELAVRLVDKKNRILQTATMPILLRNPDGDVLILHLSSDPDDFQFLTLYENVSGEKSFNGAYYHDNRTVFPGIRFNISSVALITSIHPMLIRDIRAWKLFSSVFVDYDSYIKLSPEFKSMMWSWVKAGGDLLMYPSVDLTDDEIKAALENDPYLDFSNWDIHNASALIPNNSNSLLNGGLLKFIKYGEFKNHANGFVISPIETPLIYSTVIESGTVTFLGFCPRDINATRAKDWANILFQLGLLTPPPEHFTPERQLFTSFFNRTGRGPHVPTNEFLATRKLQTSIFFFAMSYILPVLLITILAWLFNHLGRRIVFLLVILPVFIIAILFWPGIVVKMKFGKRDYEAIHLLSSSGKDCQSQISSVYMIRKCFPEMGILKIQTGWDSKVLDEFVSGSNSRIPELMVYQNPNGYLLSYEKTIEPFRVVTSEAISADVNIIEGTLTPNPNGEWEYEITNLSPYHLSNCEIFPFKRGGLNPRMIDDIPPKSSIRGKITGERDDSKLDNQNIEEFVGALKTSILDVSTKRELIFSLEALAMGISYKIYNDEHLNSDYASFLAWTSDFKSGLKVCNRKVNGPEIALITGKLKITPAKTDSLLKIHAVERLLPLKRPTEEVPSVIVNE